MPHNSIVDKYRLYRYAWVFNGSPCEEIKLTEQQRSELLAHGGLMVRNIYDFDCDKPTSFWFVVKDSFKGKNEFGKSTRCNINHAINNLSFKLIDKECVLKHGYRVVEDAYKHYRVKDRSMTEHDFTSLIEQCDVENTDFWGVFDGDNLVGLCVNIIMGSFCDIDATYVMHDYKARKYSAFYGLFYVMIDYYLRQKGLAYISDGQRSISEHSEIQSYLINNFKFRKAYCRLDVSYRWWFGLIIKMLYPFRNIIPYINVRAVLRLEEYNRQQKDVKI